MDNSKTDEKESVHRTNDIIENRRTIFTDFSKSHDNQMNQSSNLLQVSKKKENFIIFQSDKELRTRLFKNQEEILKLNGAELQNFQNDLIFFGLQELMRLISKIYDDRKEYNNKKRQLTRTEYKLIKWGIKSGKLITPKNLSQSQFLNSLEPFSEIVIKEILEEEIRDDEQAKKDYGEGKIDYDPFLIPKSDNNPELNKTFELITNSICDKEETNQEEAQSDESEKFEFTPEPDSEMSSSENDCDKTKKRILKHLLSTKELVLSKMIPIFLEKCLQRKDYFNKYKDEFLDSIYYEYLTFIHPAKKSSSKEEIMQSICGHKYLLIRMIDFQIQLMCLRVIYFKHWNSQRTHEILERWLTLIRLLSTNVNFFKKKIINWDVETFEQRIIFNSFFLDLFSLRGPGINEIFTIIKNPDIERITPADNRNFNAVYRKIHQIFREDGFLDTNDSLILKLYMHEPTKQEASSVDFDDYIQARKTELMTKINELIPNSLILISSNEIQGCDDKFVENQAAKLLIVVLHEIAHRIFMRGYNEFSVLGNTPKKIILNKISIGLPPDGDAESGDAFEMFIFNMVLSKVKIFPDKLSNMIMNTKWNQSGLENIRLCIKYLFNSNMINNGDGFMQKFKSKMNKNQNEDEKTTNEDELKVPSEEKGIELIKNASKVKFSSQENHVCSHFKDELYSYALKTYNQKREKNCVLKDIENFYDIKDEY